MFDKHNKIGDLGLQDKRKYNRGRLLEYYIEIITHN